MKTTILNNGVQMPFLGYGVFQVSPDVCEECVRTALDVGYRSIDTAQAYFNEEAVGRALKQSGVDRKEIFLTTKVWISNAGEDRAMASIEDSLRKLQTDYVDLLLIHQPFGDYYGTYRAMEKAYASGKVRAIGLSNFYGARFVDLAEHFDVKPAVVQLETHIFSQQKVMRQLVAEYGTKVMAWAPLAEGQNGLFTQRILTEIGRRYNKTAAQVALKFLTQEDIIAIPKSVHRHRMTENFALDDFSLTDADMTTIRALDTGHRLIVDSFEDPNLAKFLIHYEEHIKQ